jgi:hypothetical protein
MNGGIFFQLKNGKYLSAGNFCDQLSCGKNVVKTMVKTMIDYCGVKVDCKHF